MYMYMHMIVYVYMCVYIHKRVLSYLSERIWGLSFVSWLRGLLLLSSFLNVDAWLLDGLLPRICEKLRQGMEAAYSHKIGT